jgi:hypothetical protein
MPWKDENQDRLAAVDTMSPSGLEQLESELIKEFDDIDKNNGSLADLNDISVALQEVRGTKESRTNDLAALRSQVHPVEEDPDGDVTPGEDDDETSDEDEDSDTEPRKGSDPLKSEPGRPRVPDGIAAGGVKRPSIATLAKRAPATGPKRGRRISTRLIAAGDIPGFGVGQEITTNEQLARALVRKLEGLGRGGTPDDVLVASMVKDYPEDRTLGEDPYVNDLKMSEILKPKNLVAYGGICEPVAVDYSIDTIGSTERPLQAGLPSFAATRGGIRFTPPPVLSSITPPVPWTVADDVGGTKTKSCMTIVCGTPVEALVYGIPVCIEVGNMMGRFSPEMVQAQSALLDVATARVAELALLTTIDAGSIATTSAGTLGASRDILTTLDQLISSYEYRYRLGNATLRIVLPDWVHDLIRADVVMETAHDSQGIDPRAVTDAQIQGWFAARNASPIWTFEDLAGSWPTQAPGAVHPFPATFVAYLFAEGTWQVLDGGRIDVGVVRDSALNSTNNYQIWREDFEGLAKRGHESLKVTITTGATGASAGTNTPALP